MCSIHRWLLQFRRTHLGTWLCGVGGIEMLLLKGELRIFVRTSTTEVFVHDNEATTGLTEIGLC